MVSSIDGRVEVNGKSGAIGSDVDRSAMRTLRSKVDAVMTGSGTVRAETVSLTSEGKTSPEPYAVIPTGNLDIPLPENLKDNDPERTILLTTGDAIAKTPDLKLDALRRSAHIVECATTAEGRLDLENVISTLRSKFGIRTLLLEGGPSLNASMVSLGRVREIFLTLSPKLLGGKQEEALSILTGEALENVICRPLSIHASRKTSELFMRYEVLYKTD